MSIIKEFREFAMRGNVVDLAVGVIIGAAFGKIVSSLVADIIMPPLGLINWRDRFQTVCCHATRCAGGYPCCCDALRCLHSKRL